MDGTNEIAAALAQNQIDLISLTAEEFFTLESMGLEGPLLLPKINNGFTEEYVLLARDGGPVRAVEDLRGRGVILFSDARGSLGQTWLDVLCLEHGLGPASNALIKVKFASKGTQVILPVFFGKTDACVITRSGWEVMGELNPQVKKQLRIVAVSPPLVPVVTCFRRGFSATLMRRVIVATERSHSQVSFQQLMAIFKADEIGHQPIALLETTRQLTDARRHLAGLAPFSRVPSKEK